MNEAHPAHSTRDTSRDDEAAMPTIAIMALPRGLGGSPMDRLRSLGGMVTTYLLMGAFRSPNGASVYRSS